MTRSLGYLKAQCASRGFHRSAPVPMPLRNVFEIRHDIAIHVHGQREASDQRSNNNSCNNATVMLGGTRHVDVETAIRGSGGREMAWVIPSTQGLMNCGPNTDSELTDRIQGFQGGGKENEA